jgi:hypothetical protein
MATPMLLAWLSSVRRTPTPPRLDVEHGVERDAQLLKDARRRKQDQPDRGQCDQVVGFQRQLRGKDLLREFRHRLAHLGLDGVEQPRLDQRFVDRQRGQGDDDDQQRRQGEDGRVGQRGGIDRRLAFVPADVGFAQQVEQVVDQHGGRAING